MIDAKAVLFDLDGTLLNTLDDLADSMNCVLQQLGRPTHPIEAYKYFVGDGIQALAKRVLPLKDQDNRNLIDETVRMMVAEYNQRWDAKTELYPGIAELLSELVERKVVLAIFSNKPDHFTQETVTRFLNDWSFAKVIGAQEGIAKKPAPQGAKLIAEALDIAPEKFLYLGDTNTDMHTAIGAGMLPVGVLWGFRTRDELTRAGARHLLSAPQDLFSLLDFPLS